MKLRDLEYLIASVAAGNFTRAANSLGISTSTISRRIGRLEDELGLAIFERRHSGIRLTTGGKDVLMHARRAFAEFEAVKFAGKQNGIGAVGEVRLGGPSAADQRSDTHVAERMAKSTFQRGAVGLRNERAGPGDRARRAAARCAARAQLHAPVSHGELRGMPRKTVRGCSSEPWLARPAPVTWRSLNGETILVQGWDDSQAEREFLAPLLGSEVCFRSHAASRQSLLGLVAGGFGIVDRDGKRGGSRVSRCPLPSRSTKRTPFCSWILPGCRRPRSPRSAASSPSYVTRSGHAGLSEADAVRRNFAKARSVAMKRASIGPISFAGSTVPWPVSRPRVSAIGDEVAVNGGRQLDREPHRLVVLDPAELQLCHDAAQRE